MHLPLNDSLVYIHDMCSLTKLSWSKISSTEAQLRVERHNTFILFRYKNTHVGLTPLSSHGRRGALWFSAVLQTKVDECTSGIQK